MKHLNDFTLKEFQEYTQLIGEKKPDVFSIMELFGIKDSYDLPNDKFQKYWKQINSMELSTKGLKRIYKINGMRFEAQLEILSLSAGQFIDLQNYISNFKLEQVLSVFMLPQYKKGIVWKTHKYNDGYDPLKIQEFLFNNMKISEASALSAFFLTISKNLLEIMKDSSERKLMKMRKQRLKTSQKQSLTGSYVAKTLQK